MKYGYAVSKKVLLCGVISVLMTGIVFKGEAAKITLIEPASATVGTTIRVEGEGYTPSETVRIDLSGQFGAAKVECCATGTFSADFVLGNFPFGKARFVVVGFKSFSYNEGFIDVKGNLAEVTPKSGTVGALVTLTGNGYKAKEGIQIDFGNLTNIVTKEADEAGRFGIVFSVPSQTAGSKAITIKGIESEQSHQAKFEVEGDISSMEPTYGVVDTPVRITGAGFGNNEPIKIDFGITKDIFSTKSDEQGNVVASFNVDIQPEGRKTVTVRGLLSGEVGERFFVVKPGIFSVSPASGVIGAKVTIKGSGFGISEPIRVDMGRTLAISRTQSDDNGIFEAVFPVDAQPRGIGRIAAVGLHSRKVSFTDAFEVLSSVILNPESGPVGTNVQIEGCGFPVNEQIKIDFGMNTTGAIATADGRRGSFAANVVVETQPAGLKDVIVTAGEGKEKYKAQFEVKGEVRLVSPSAGDCGTLVQVSGDGYGVEEKIMVDLGKTKGIGQGQSDEKGCFKLTFKVDTQVGGNKEVNIYGLTSGQKDTSQFSINSKLVISPVSGTSESMVKIDGSGYGPTESVRIDCGRKVGVAEATTDENGSFEVDFNIGEQLPGTLRIVGIGLKTYHISSANFTVVEPVKEEAQPEQVQATQGQTEKEVVKEEAQPEQVQATQGQTEKEVVKEEAKEEEKGSKEETAEEE